MRLSTQELVRAAMFAALMCVLTIMVRIFQPLVVIPFSLQPLVMLLAACLLSPRAAFLSMLAYLGLGLIGIPVFSMPPYGGPAYVLVPSFGFILAFPIAAWVQSRLIKRVDWLNFIGSGLAGIAVMYAIGLVYMYFILNFYLGHTVDVLKVLELGFIPYFTFDLIKLVLASWLGLELSRRLDIKRESIGVNELETAAEIETDMPQA
ncbi:MAG: biotin transporter BioY [Deltaproteobacteria bacterium]